MAQKPDRGRVEISRDECKGCQLCISVCPVHVLELGEGLNRQGYRPAVYKGAGCTGCGFCFYACPEPGAVTVFRIAKSA
jgi:NAD-dependent dihydropyrimidine dehydrogenase PreA subunit